MERLALIRSAGMTKRTVIGKRSSAFFCSPFNECGNTDEIQHKIQSLQEYTKNQNNTWYYPQYTQHNLILSAPQYVQPLQYTPTTMTYGGKMQAHKFSTRRNDRLKVSDLPKGVRNCEYAVRGEIVTKAMDIDAFLAENPNNDVYPFKATLHANIGNPQAVGQKSVTFHRQVLAGVCNPQLTEIIGALPADVSERVKSFNKNCGSVGAYSNSKGVAGFRKNVADFLETRDGYPANVELVYLTDGASPGIKLMIELLINGPNDAIMIPVPQYPLYSASLVRQGGTGVNYYLEEAEGWKIDMANIEKTLLESQKNGLHVKALVVINPGNPTGAVFEQSVLEEVCRFCQKHNLVLLSDEVYQENIYTSTPFVSCRKVALDLGLKDLQLVSFHSCSKGIFGECGIRGGFFHMQGFEPEIAAQIYKLSSISLCSNLIGQTLMASIVQPPKETDVSYLKYKEETDNIFNSLKRKAIMIHEKLNELEGVRCQIVQGAMYAFPSITLSQKAILEAEKKSMKPDMMYCLEMLDETGILTVPGSGFGQVEGTWHYRMTILPPEDAFPELLNTLAKFHKKFMDKYR